MEEPKHYIFLENFIVMSLVRNIAREVGPDQMKAWSSESVRNYDATKTFFSKRETTINYICRKYFEEKI